MPGAWHKNGEWDTTLQGSRRQNGPYHLYHTCLTSINYQATTPPPSRAVGCEIDAYEEGMMSCVITSKTHTPSEFYHLHKIAWQYVLAKNKCTEICICSDAM